MRTFFNGAGADVSSTVYAYLASTDQEQLADLVLIGELEDPFAYFLTNWESPLLWPLWGTFQPAVINRGKITSQIGLQVDVLDFTWSPLLTAFGTSLATANVYQKALSGFFDNKKFRLWRTVMPTPGDANTYGACIVFGGRIADTTVVRGQIQFSVSSLLDAINQKVPPNVIENTSVLANYAGNTPVVADNESRLPQFTVVAPSTETNVLARCTFPTANKLYSANKFYRGFIQFNPGSSLAGYYSAVAANGPFNIGGGVKYNQFILYGALPWPPQPGDTFYASVQPPINQQDTTSLFGAYTFPSVPSPETAV